MPPDSPARVAAMAVARRLADRGHRVLFAGGCVRDRLLGREPADYDLATSATPEEGEALFPHAVTVGARFGVVVVPVEGLNVEVATFRADGLYVDGRRPEGVVFSDPPTDASRRDFTVNGLFEEPFTGEILDYVGGRADLSARLLRAIGDPEARLREDHLRVMRAVRFAVQLGFAMEPRTFDAVRALAPLVASVSAERVRDELLKTLKRGRGRGLRLLEAAGLLPVVLPEAATFRGVTQPPQFHPEGDVFVHTALVLDGLALDGLSEGDQDSLVLAALLHDVGKPPTRSVDESDGRIRFNGHDALGATMGEAILERLRLPTKRTAQVADLVARHMPVPEPAEDAAPSAAAVPRAGGFRAPPPTPSRRLRRGARRPDAREVLRGAPRVVPVRARAPARDRARRAPVGGRLRPGPRLGALLRWVREQQLDGLLTSRDDAVRRVLEAYPPDSAERPPS